MGEVMIRALHFSNAILPYDVVDTALTRFDRAKIDLLALTGLTMPPVGGYRVGEKYEVQTPVSYTHLTLPTNREV